MKKRFTEEQIIRILGEAEAGTKVKDLKQFKGIGIVDEKSFLRKGKKQFNFYFSFPFLKLSIARELQQLS